ncbi:hypothetical protein QFC22_000809 [Naganishia vaughanmartiniae]|uniref:Uncharacterized protein n=1 Tax=Naganishia vaughanmartiniae TaxID=1424756 RepID=A0ACC2XL79_9TREE|nr:hypothetical protein QFC22_000809 [Naganishia vaughanmartiniae]
MQYLSRAYQYYSGINPATLTGAIDIIVVRRKDENGEEFYSCSPFHVRFGKLQVLRAGEKKVQLQLPDNLPEPFEAPFWMKVGEAGEAFFVVETDQEVPEELQTSPVMSATEVPPLSPPTFGNESPRDAETGDNDLSATLKPFGKGRGDVSTPEFPDRVNGSEPDFLNLDDHTDSNRTPLQQHASLGHTPRMASLALPGLKNVPPLLNIKVPIEHAASSASPSTILNAASSLLPSFLHSSPSSPDRNKSMASKSDPTISQSIPPNPLEAKEASDELFRAQKIEDYVRDHRQVRSRTGSTASVSSTRSKSGYNDRADAHLPHVAAGEGEGPDVQYTKDAVLDAMGYHADTYEAKNDASEQEQHDVLQDSALVSAQVLSENMSLGDSITLESENHLIQFAQDLLVSAGAPVDDLQTGKIPGQQEYEPSAPITSQDVVVREIARRLNSLSLENPSSSRESELVKAARATSHDHDRLVPRRDNFIRGQSEPPPDTNNESGMTQLPQSESPSPYPEEAPDYTWEWGGFPMKTPGIAEQEFNFKQNKEVDKPERKLPQIHKLVKEELVRSKRSNSTPVAGMVKENTSSSERPKLSSQHAQTDPVLPDDAHASPQGGLQGQHGHGGKLKNDEDDPYKFMLDTLTDCHSFELSICAPDDNTDVEVTEEDFDSHRITFRSFVEDPSIVDNPNLVIKYGSSYLTWQNASPVLAALAVYRRSLLPPLPVTASQKLGNELPAPSSQSKASNGYAWSRWWRRGQSAGIPLDNSSSASAAPLPPPQQTVSKQNGEVKVNALEPKIDTDVAPSDQDVKKYYAKTLRLTSDQLKSLCLKVGANKIVFSVNSSYSGVASCTARIFLWEEDDRVVISDIDGTITKSDALGHVFAAIGRDWTHLGVAKLYTDICNNGYKIMYLTSRAIGQADSTRDYLKSISQGSYQLPEGPVIMSPDRLFTSLHREVIMRKPEVFKMACLRDIQRLFGNGAKTAFYAGFGNRITDAMSYRSVNVPSSRIFTIDSGGEVKMELLELAGYKSSYIHMTDLVDQMFPPVNRKLQPEYTDFNYWRPSIPDIPLPDLTPASPALSATSESSRLGLLRNMASGIARRASRQTITSEGTKSPQSQTSRPTSPLVGPSIVAGDADFDSMSESEDVLHDRTNARGSSMPGSLPGSFDDRADYLNDEFFDQRYRNEPQDNHHQRKDRNGNPTSEDEYGYGEQGGHSEDDVYPEMFDDDLLATGEMSKVPF